MRALLIASVALITGPAAAAPVETPPPVSGRAVAVESILPADVLARATLVRDELELIRFEMGRPSNRRGAPQIEEAAPREVWFQAATLFGKADELALELLRDAPAEAPVPPAEVSPYHVFLQVDAAMARLLQVKQTLGITTQSKEATRPTSTTPSQVFAAMVQANRQLNLLLQRPTGPSDVYSQITLATGYAARLLARFPAAVRFPEPPPLERGRLPQAVYERLFACLERITNIARMSRVKVMKLEQEAGAIPSSADNYDLTRVIVSELTHLHGLSGDPRHPPGIWYPGRRFPSHAHQRAGLLLRQLEALERFVTENPDWLR